MSLEIICIYGLQNYLLTIYSRKGIMRVMASQMLATWLSAHKLVHVNNKTKQRKSTLRVVCEGNRVYIWKVFPSHDVIMIINNINDNIFNAFIHRCYGWLMHSKCGKSFMILSFMIIASHVTSIPDGRWLVRILRNFSIVGFDICQYAPKPIIVCNWDVIGPVLIMVGWPSIAIRA